eukprot:g44141.t1
MPPKKKEEKAPAEEPTTPTTPTTPATPATPVAEIDGGIRALGLAGKKGAKKGGSKKGVRKSPQKVASQGTVYVVFRNNDPLSPYVCTDMPGADVKEVNAHEAKLLTYLHPTSKRDHAVALSFDGTYQVFLSWENAVAISKKQGKRLKAIFNATWVGDNDVAEFFDDEEADEEEGEGEDEGEN